MKTRSARFALAALAATVIACAIAALAAPAPSPLDELGRAYAECYGLTLDRVETRPATIPADKLIGSLAVGYTEAPGRLRTVPLSLIGELGKLTMAGDRSPEQVVRQVATPGRTILEATWSFAGCEPIHSFAVLDTDGEPLFDTLLSLPVVPGPILTPGHF
ncbi:MAG: hypothetical protein HYU66_29215 [Armatimonadetes bacterium]|nr:hypothetical protein [Armatimonadota bacterium]